MNAPPPYPRIPRLQGPSEGDLLVPAADRAAWLRDPVVVEEKLDGANVAVWFDDEGRVQVSGRGGLGAMDRAGQLGRLRAWAAERTVRLDELLGSGTALYGEWLWMEHSVPYDLLPDYLMVLDLWSPTAGFHPVDVRNAQAASSGLFTPPVVHAGPAGDLTKLSDLSRRSAFRRGPAEGVVLRREHIDGGFDRCKWVRDDFARKPDDGWQGRLEHNRLSKTVSQAHRPPGRRTGRARRG